jgi:hypothetical protein
MMLMGRVSGSHPTESKGDVGSEAGAPLTGLRCSGIPVVLHGDGISRSFCSRVGVATLGGGAAQGDGMLGFVVRR